MSDVMLGKLPNVDSCRDAIHVAVIPMVASEMLRPGQRVGIVGPSTVGPSSDVIGIVDPFLQDVVPKGSRFWLMLLPNTVTGMRHHWAHPKFSEDEITKGHQFVESEAWLRNIAGQFDMTYEELMSPDCELVNGEFITQPGSEDWRELWYGIEDEFWRHYENVTGRPVEMRNRGGFSCSC